ncbi:MAG: hypothetical protein U5R49_25135 [Deltaproteobacteria bacterium]|nr:hypothetical protein [Deltaproteobacteria bacterium]
MGKTIKSLVFLLLVSTLILPPLTAVAGGEYYNNLSDKAGFMVADFLIIRPAGMVATAAGSILYVLSLPFSIPGGNQPEAYEKMVLEPARYTFTRPLGEP